MGLCTSATHRLHPCQDPGEHLSITLLPAGIWSRNRGKVRTPLLQPEPQLDVSEKAQSVAAATRVGGVCSAELKPAVEAPYGHGHVSHTPPASLPGSRRASLYDPAAGRHLVQKTGTGEPQGVPRAKYLRGDHEAANLGSPAGSGSVKQRSGNLQRMRSMTTAEDGYEAR